MTRYSEYKEKLSKKTENKTDWTLIFENILIGIIILFLSLHLFTVHSKLLFHINPDNLVEDLTYKFNKTLFSQELIVSTIGSIAYSLITALILTIFVRYKKVFIISVISFALLDGIGVFVYYNVTIGQELFLITGAIYYAIYTSSIIVSLGLFRYLGYSSIQENTNTFDYNLNKSILEDDIMELRETLENIRAEYNKNKNIHDKGFINTPEDMLSEKVVYLSKEKKLTQKEIAERVGISQPQISRILQKSKSESDL